MQNTRQGQNHQPGGESLGGGGKKRGAESQEPVGAQFHHQGGKHHGRAGRSFGIGVGQPAVQGKKGNLDQESQGEGQETPELDILGKMVLQKDRVVETVGLVGDIKQGHQHQKGPEEGEEDELHRGFDPSRAAPDPDQEKNRDQHQLPEEIKKKKIPRGQGSQHGRFQKKQAGEITADVFLDA